MSSNAGERDVARRMGFGRPRPRLPLSSGGESNGSPKTLLDKLGVRSGMQAAFVGVTDPHLTPLRWHSPVRMSATAPPHPVDVIVYQAENTFALRRVRELAPYVKQGGALWVLWPRDQSHINEGHVQRSGTAAGLIDVAAIGVSDRLAGLKFVHKRRER